ncbi:hypothetical protein [Rhodopila sp.]|uniref:hypothetical protein n=1 Tax=Rhodopila sp. TaxID=2480087 RepID=UPI003D0C0ADA
MLIGRENALQCSIWRIAESIARLDPPSRTSSLLTASLDMFGAAQNERFAFDSPVPADLSWMLMGGSMLAIGAMGCHLGSSGARQVVLTSLLWGCGSAAWC